MIRRAFLGWQEPFLRPAAKWLLGLGNALAETCILVPTGQAGRSLSEEMTRLSGAMLAPRMTTPGAWMSRLPANTAPDWAEYLAWNDVFSSFNDWDSVSAAFPVPASDEMTHQALAQEMTSLRRALQEAGLTLASAAAAMQNSMEADRWSALSTLESLVEERLGLWGLLSRNQALADGISPPSDIRHLVLVGVSEMPPCVERAILSWEGEVWALIGAPDSHAEKFSSSGLPLPCWAHRPMPWPDEPQHGSVKVVADARSQASAAIDLIAIHATPVDDLALGSADAPTAMELSRQLTTAGWTAFSPGSPVPTTGLLRWLHVWLRWLETPSLQVLADLLALPETSIWVSGNRAILSANLATYRDASLARNAEDLQMHLNQNGAFRTAKAQQHAKEILLAVTPLLEWRTKLLESDPGTCMSEWLHALGSAGGDAAEQASALAEWWLGALPFNTRCPRSMTFWLRLMLNSQAPPTPKPPEGRVIDVQGWLELFFEAGNHLIICGLNEGNVPDSPVGNTWIAEGSAKQLGLRGRDERAARDAFLFQSMLEARKLEGRVDLLCAKIGAGGQPMLPSRLLLHCDRKELPNRVIKLFREVAPPDAGVRPVWDWRWTPTLVKSPAHFSVTALRDYLACPFRFYLNHLLRMRSPQPDRTEWSAADFGTVSHAVLEAWGRDPIANRLEDPEQLSDWLLARLDYYCASQFAGHPPLGIRLQIESLRQRFVGFARQQAVLRSEGWEVVDVETQVKLDFNGVEIRATIDRIDRHSTGALRVIDYKTGEVESVEKAHRKTIKSNSKPPEHLAADSPVFFNTGKATLQWINLQLPLYAVAAHQHLNCAEIPIPCYFVLGASGSSSNFQPWMDFSQIDADAALDCTRWILQQIQELHFWPPAARVDYDAIAILTGGNQPQQIFLPPQ